MASKGKRTVDVTAPGKLVVLAIVVAGCFGFIIASLFAVDVDATPAWAMLTLVVGYLIGNGSGARKGVVTVAPFSPTPERQIQRLQQEVAERDDGPEA